MDEDYYKEQFINFFGHKYLDSNSVICDFVKDPKYFPVKNDKVITMSRYLGSTVWEMAYKTQILQKKQFKQKRWVILKVLENIYFLEEFKQKQKDYVLNTLNKIFCDLDRWIEIKNEWYEF